MAIVHKGVEGLTYPTVHTFEAEPIPLWTHKGEEGLTYPTVHTFEAEHPTGPLYN